MTSTVLIPYIRLLHDYVDRLRRRERRFRRAGHLETRQFAQYPHHVRNLAKPMPFPQALTRLNAKSLVTHYRPFVQPAFATGFHLDGICVYQPRDCFRAFAIEVEFRYGILSH